MLRHLRHLRMILLELFLQQRQRIAQPCQRLRADQRRVAQREIALAQRQQRARQVAAVYCGDIGGRQRAQALGVVPVQQVAPVALQPLHAVHRALGARGELLQADVAKIVGGQVGQQLEANVGGRGAVSDQGPGRLLKIVGRQEVGLGAHEALEVGPGGAGEPAQQQLLLGG